MSQHDPTAVWLVMLPSAWPKAPHWMSLSTLSDLEACPRRWALSNADYPHIWARRGYPRTVQLSTLEGTVVHLSLERLTRAFSQRGCSSLFDECATSTLRELGGFTAVIGKCIEQALRAYNDNPRAVPVLEGISQRLRARVPELRTRVQRLLARIHLGSYVISPSSATITSTGKSRHQVWFGCHTEVELRAIELGWHGVADLLSLSEEGCEIRDFKTGSLKHEHEFQLHTYALLWARDRELNPSGRLADKLVLSYNERDVDVSVPISHDLDILEVELRTRTETAVTVLLTDFPEARPSTENCAYCSVRHLCDEYWQWRTQDSEGGERPNDDFIDLQIKLTARHGPTAWDSIIESPAAGRPLLLRTSNLQFNLQSGQRVRLLNVHVSTRGEEPGEEKRPHVVATMGTSTELFMISDRQS